MKRHIYIMAAALALAGCGGGGGGTVTGPQTGTAECSIDGQKQFVLDNMRDWYFWEDLLPASVDINAYASPEDLLTFLTSFQPIDRFSFIGSAAADAAFFGEGRFVGFGFTSTFVSDDEVRFVRVIGGSPADQGGIARGQRLLAVDGRTIAQITAAEGLSAAFGDAEEGVMRTLRIDDNGVERDVVLTKAIVTIDPVPQVKTFTVDNTTYGYVEFSTFIRPANDQLDDAFADFRANNINSLILDLRYNGGGLVSVAERLGDLLGGETNNGDVFSETLFNANNTDSNSVRRFSQLASSLSLSELVVITTGGTASASELVINSLEPVTNVRLVGTATFGKPVGQIGLDFCEKILRPTAFETVNSLGDGGYFDGLPVDCEAADDISTVVGTEEDPSTAAALTLLSTGACPVAAPVNEKAQAGIRAFRPPAGRTAAEVNAYVH